MTTLTSIACINVADRANSRGLPKRALTVITAALLGQPKAQQRDILMNIENNYLLIHKINVTAYARKVQIILSHNSIKFYIKWPLE